MSYFFCGLDFKLEVESLLCEVGNDSTKDVLLTSQRERENDKLVVANLVYSKRYEGPALSTPKLISCVSILLVMP